MFSHPNDEGWDPFLVGAPLVLQEEDSESGRILQPGHGVFAKLMEQTEVAGAKMYDSVAYADSRWRVLMADAKARPAVLECQVGQGRAIVCVPSFERYLTGELAARSEASGDACRAVFRGLVEYAVSRPEPPPTP